MKRYICSSKEYVYGPYTYTSKYALEKAAESSTNIDELETIAQGKLNGTIEYKLAKNPSTPKTILISLAQTTQSLHALNELVRNPNSDEDVLDILTARYLAGDAVEFSANPIRNLFVHRPDYHLSRDLVRYAISKNPKRLDDLYYGGRFSEIDNYLDDDFMLDIINKHWFSSDISLCSMAELWNSPVVLDALQTHPNKLVQDALAKNPNIS